MQIRKFTSSDLDAGLALCRASNWNQLAEDWLCFTEHKGGRVWLAESEGAVAGSIAMLDYGEFTWLAMMLVAPQFRRQGIGKQLMRQALDWAGERLVRLDATPAGEPMYRGFDFAPEYPLLRATLTVRGDTPEKNASRARPMTPEDLPRVLAWDRTVFGADRGALLRDFYRRAPRLAWMLEGEGYCFGRPGHRHSQIGPITGTVDAVRQLLLACLAENAGKTFVLDLSAGLEEQIASWNLGQFAVERPFVRMARGANPPPAPSPLQFAIAGPEFG